MSTVNQSAVTVNEPTSKGGDKMLNVRGPKRQAFNLSASVTDVAFIYNGQLLKMPMEFKKAAKFLRQNGLLKSDELGTSTLNPESKPFIYLPAFEVQESKDEQGAVTKRIIPLDSVLLSRRNGNTLVQRNSESALIRDVCELKVFKVEMPNMQDRSSIVHEEVEAYDNLKQLNLEVVEVTQFLHHLLTDEKLGIKMPELEAQKFIRETVLNGVMLDNGSEAKLYTLNSAAPSQTRKGEAAFYLFGEIDKDSRRITTLEALFNNSRARAEAVYSRFSSSFKLQVFGKLKDDKRYFKMDKDPKRLDMHASGSKPSNVHQRLFGKMKVIMKFSYEDAVGDMQMMTVLESVKPMHGGVKRRIALVEDLFIEVEQETIVVKKPKLGATVIDGIVQDPSLAKGVFRFKKNMTDGGILVSHDVAKYLAKEGHFQSNTQSFQARGSNGVKPFAYTVHKLRELSECDMILLGGARKLDVLPSLLDGTYKLSVVQGARVEEDKQKTLVATQALLAMATPAKNLKMLNMMSSGFVQSSLHDVNKAKQILNIEMADQQKTIEEDDGQMTPEEEKFMGASMDPKERGIKRIIQESYIGLKDFVQKQSLLSLMSKPLEKIRKGHIFMDNAAMKHMGFDVYLVATAIGDVIRKHLAGETDIKMVYVDSIPVGKVVIVKYGGGLRKGTCLLVRYPILKHEEVQKVRTAVEFSEEAQRYYEEASEQGFYQGLVLFNALDMMSEAMSGADFDGDTCLVIFNPLVVAPFKPRTMILDYFMDEETGELEGGCPWSDPREAPSVFEILGDEMPEGLYVEQVEENGLRTWTIAFKEQDVHTRPMAVYYVFNRMAAAHIVQTAKQSSIGRWTNILMNVEDILLEIEQEIELAATLNMRDKKTELEEEHAHYELLAKWLVYVVRWAIDEAKHGGAFSHPLKNIIGHLEERPYANMLRSLHEAEAFFPTRLFVMEGK